MDASESHSLARDLLEGKEALTLALVWSSRNSHCLDKGTVLKSVVLRHLGGGICISRIGEHAASGTSPLTLRLGAEV